MKSAKNLSIPLVATNDCHYLNRDHAEAHDVLLCIQTGKTIEDNDRMRLGTDQFYFRSPEEMQRDFFSNAGGFIQYGELLPKDVIFPWNSVSFTCRILRLKIRKKL